MGETNAISFAKFHQRQQNAIALVYPFPLFGKIIYSYNLFTFKDMSQVGISYIYKDQGFEILYFSCIFLLPLTWQVHESMHNRAFRQTTQRPQRTKKLFGLIVFIVVFMNFVNEIGSHRYIGTLISSSAMLQVISRMRYK